MILNNIVYYPKPIKCLPRNGHNQPQNDTVQTRYNYGCVLFIYILKVVIVLNKLPKNIFFIFYLTHSVPFTSSTKFKQYRCAARIKSKQISNKRLRKILDAGTHVASRKYSHVMYALDLFMQRNKCFLIELPMSW